MKKIMLKRKDPEKIEPHHKLIQTLRGIKNITIATVCVLLTGWLLLHTLVFFLRLIGADL